MKIFLRPITERDTSIIVHWRNTDKVRSHCMSKSPITESSHLKFYKDNDGNEEEKSITVKVKHGKKTAATWKKSAASFTWQLPVPATNFLFPPAASDDTCR